MLGYVGTTGPAAAGADPSQGYCDSLPESDLSRLTFIRPVASIQDPESAGEVPAATATATPAAPEAHSATAPVAEPSPMPKAAAAAATPKPEPAKPADTKPDQKTAAKPVEAGVKDKPKPESAPKTPAAKAPASAKSATKAPAAKVPAAAAPVAKAPAAAPAPATPAAVAAKPKPETAPSTGGMMIPAGARYVQVGTYADAANADRVAQAIAAMGYPVLRGKDKVGARAVQFIMAGPFNDRQSIVKAMDAIRRAGFKDAYPR